ncbi:MAG TPA: MFS transporter [Candidatus Limnocylindrales bacterium]|nr:MFS transporter [Candidatus Limnocylindrales bacterium]
MSPPSEARAARIASWAVFGVFAVSGFVFASWVSRLPAIRDELGLTPGQIGLVLLVGSAGSMVALPLTGAVVERIGTQRTTRMAALLSTAGFVAAALAVGVGSTPLVAAFLFVALMGISAWDVAMNLQGTVVEHDLGRAIMPRFHAGFSLGAVAGAATGALAAAAGVPATWHIIGAVLLACAAVLALTRRYLPDGAMTTSDEDGNEAEGERRSPLAAWAEPRTLMIGLMVLAAALTEGSANDWLALSVVDGFSTSDAVGALAFGLFVASMTAMRFAGTRLLDRFGRVPVLRLCAGLALIGLVVFALAPSLPLAVIAIVLWGLGAALGFPVGMSAAADDPARSAARVSVVSTIGYVAFLAGPPVLGLLADHVGYRMALLTIAAPLVLSLILSSVAAPLPAAQGGAAPGQRA